MYNHIKGLLSTSSEEEFREFDSYTSAVPVPAMTICHEDTTQHQEETSSSLTSIINMAKDCTQEAQTEGARILCDLAMDISMQQILVDRGCLLVLKDLICTAQSDWAKTHAIIALSILSDAKIYQVSLLANSSNLYTCMVYMSIHYVYTTCIQYTCLCISHR